MTTTVAVLFLALAMALEAPAAPRPLDKGQFRTLMETLAQGWTEGDAKKAAECFTADAVYGQAGAAPAIHAPYPPAAAPCARVAAWRRRVAAHTLRGHAAR